MNHFYSITKLGKYFWKCDPRHSWNADEFDQEFAPFSDRKDVHSFIDEALDRKIDKIHYKPGSSQVENIDGFQSFNVYIPPTIYPEKGDPSPFIEYMEHLFPEKQSRD